MKFQLLFLFLCFLACVYSSTNYPPQRILFYLKSKNLPPSIEVTYYRNNQIILQNEFTIVDVNVLNVPGFKFDYPLVNITSPMIVSPVYVEAITPTYYPMQLYHLSPNDQLILNQNNYNVGSKIGRVIVGDDNYCIEFGVLIYNNNIMNNLVPYVRSYC